MVRRWGCFWRLGRSAFRERSSARSIISNGARIETLFAEMMEEAVAALRQAGVTDREMTFQRTADMRYRGQRKELTITLPRAKLGRTSVTSLRASFEQRVQAHLSPYP